MPETRRRRTLNSAMALLTSLLVMLSTVVPATASGPPPGDRTATIEPAAIEPAALTSGQLALVRVTGGLSSPLGVTNAGDGSGRLFVVERGGRVRVVKGGTLQSGFFLDVGSRIVDGGEQGLLGLAFHPDFATNRYLYTYYTRPGGDIVIARMRANAARTSASLATEQVLLVIEHSENSNHNGGAMAFGPDGYLYIGTGDGGGGGDPLDNGQDISNELLGKILRIDPGLTGGYAIPPSNPFVGVSGDDEIWAYGVRNPWRISFDRESSDLFIADVGQGRYEEVNRAAAGHPGGRNYGWNVMEGTQCYAASSCNKSDKVLPTAVYTHASGCSITGGYVYRGAHRDLQALYVFGDFCSGRIWTMPRQGGAITQRRDTSLSISSFGESEGGELYLTDLTGSLYRVIAPEFSDIATSSFMDHIHWLYYEGITGGCGSGKFCPKSSVTRVQMAQFLVRAFGYPTTKTNYFVDDEGISGESSINALALAGITGGCSANRFCPTARVTRAQMAIFLAKALNLPSAPAGVDYFDDDDGRTGESAINAMAHAGMTGGCGTRRYCPTANVTREQMAAFLRRALDN